MRHPLPIAIASATVLIALGLPFLNARFIGVDASVLPPSAHARAAEDALRRHFPPGADSPIHVAATVADPAPTLAAIRRLPGIGTVAPPQRLGAGLWEIEVIPRAAAMSSSTKSIVRSIRRLPQVAVAGRTAWYLDTAASLVRYLPVALGLLAIVTFGLLYAVTRSVVLPLKALLMNVLGLSAAFGLLVLIFQDGRLQGLLNYKSQGALELTQPALLFAIAFGLATDYAVFLLSRIKEAHDSGLENREAVALGLERTGRVVTSAALLFCVAVGAFATSSIVIVKEVGIGIALAVAIDATLDSGAPRAQPDGAARRLELVARPPSWLRCARWNCCLREVGSTAAQAASASPASRTRGFFVSRELMDAYDAKAIEQKWQEVWEHRAGVPRRQPRAGRRARRALLHARDAAVPVGQPAHGARPQLHAGGRRHALPPPARLHGAAADGLRLVRAAGRERRDQGGRPPARDHRAQHRGDPSPDAPIMGWAIDWQREVSAHEPTYYRWTQWLFLKLFEHGLAYRKEAPVNWCPNDQTVLANEHVVDGRCWRCGAIVEARNMAQWFFKITAYADELLDDLATIDWPERTKKIQTNWIGRSEGAEMLFRVDELDLDIPVFTTRPDTLFGATFFVVAPESPLVDELVEGTSSPTRCARTRASPAARPTEEREQREKTGVFTGRYATNPVERRADPDLGRRLRADGVRHRRDHGGAGARRARP